MKIKFFLGFLFLTLAFQAKAQTLDSVSTTQNQTISAEKSEPTEKKSLSTDSDNSNKSASQPSQTPQAYVRPDSKTRFNRYWQSTVGPFALARTVVSAGLSTWRNTPEEWGTHWEGFGKRVASNLGTNAIRNTTTYALSEAFKLDGYFYRSQNRSTGARIKNAVISPFTARNKDGKRVFGFPNLVGTYTANVIATETWFPSRYNYKDGLRDGTISLGTSVLYNLVREFIRK